MKSRNKHARSVLPKRLSPMHLRYRPEIDGMRALALIPVILFHAGVETFGGGFIGVDVFFVISGYLITTIILAELAEGRFSVLRFYERRARRILPALSVVMAACIGFAWAWMLPHELVNFGRSLLAVSLFSSNILFWRESGYFEPANELKPLLHTWSLAVEEQFYLLFPPLLLLLWRFARRYAAAALAVAALASLALSEWMWRVADVANFFLAPTRAWELLAGALCAFALWNRQLRQNGALGLAGLAAIVLATFLFNHETPTPSLYTLLPVTGAALVILFGNGSAVGKLLSHRLLVGIGLISYSAYLWHQPLFAFARLSSVVPPSQTSMLALAVLALVLGYLSWRFVETPFRRKERVYLPNRQRLFVMAGSVAVLFIALGSIVVAKAGFPARWSKHSLEAIALLKRLAKERQAGIRNRKCHFNPRDIEIATFLKQWNCHGIGEPDLEDAHVAIFGDSTAADKAWAMRANRQNVLQLSGANCSLAPSKMAPGCHDLAERFKAVIAESKTIDRVWLVNVYELREVKEDRFAELLDYWSGLGPPVYIFGPPPSYSNLEQVYYIGELDQLAVDREALNYFERKNLTGMAERKGLSIIDGEKLLCAAFPKCYPFLDGAPLLRDSVHITPLGARLLGQQLMKYARQPVVARSRRPG